MVIKHIIKKASCVDSEVKITQKGGESVELDNSIDVGWSADHTSVDQAKKNDVIKDAEENKRLHRELDDAFDCLMSLANPIVLTDNRSLDQPMENDAIKDVQERKIIHKMKDMVSICASYTTGN